MARRTEAAFCENPPHISRNSIIASELWCLIKPGSFNFGACNSLMDIMDVYMDDFLLPISGKHFMKNTDLSQGCERSLFFFYKFRIGCTCLGKKCASSAVQKNLFCDGSETSLDKFLHAILRNSTHRCFFQSKLKEDNPLLSQ